MQINPGSKIQQKALLWQQIAKRSRELLSFEQCKQIFHSLYQDDPLGIAWLPDEKDSRQTHLHQLLSSLSLKNYEELYQWSVQNKAAYWEKVVDSLSIRFENSYDSILEMKDRDAENPYWMPGASLNIVNSCFQAPKDKTAIIADDETGEKTSISYGELQQLCQQVSSGLVQQGLKKGDRILLYLPLCPEAVAAYLGIIQAGMVAVLVADSFSATELTKRIKASEAKAIITVDSYLYNGKPLRIYDKVIQAEAPLSILINTTPDTQLRKKDILWQDFLQEANYDAHIDTADALISILFSSGTTSEPKAIPWTQLTPIKCAADGRFHHDIHASDVVTWTTGMGWMMGPWTIFATLMNQATLALFTGSAAGEAFGKFTQESGITVLGTIPSLVKVWKASGVMEQFEWKVRVFSSTGEPSQVDDYLYLMWLQRFRAPIIEYCGGTEIGGGYITGSLLQSASPATFTTPALGMELFFRDEESGKLSNRQSGEVFIKPPSMGLSQYLLNKDHHEEYYADTPVLEEGTYLRRHGDNYLYYELAEGINFFKSRGRSDDSMNLGGIKVSAVEIEKVVAQHPVVYESAAVAMAPADGGPERLLLFVVPSQEIDDIHSLKNTLQKMLTKELNPLFRISEIILRKELPRTASNKLMRRTLRKEYQEENKL
ncbi:MAG: AMP-binding protein [Cyclobacteriaceae bacterium]